MGVSATARTSARSALDSGDLLRQRFQDDRRVRWGIYAVILLLVILLPYAFQPASPFVDHCITALAYVVMALGLNIVVGFAGLLDLGYVAFFAIGAYSAGWVASDFFASINGGKGLHLLAGSFAAHQPGIHFNFVLVLVTAVVFTSIAGVLIGLPTLRLRGDYIAIVTLAFGEIIGRVAINGDDIHIFGQQLTAGRQGITPVDPISLPGIQQFGLLDLRPWYWFVLVL